VGFFRQNLLFSVRAKQHGVDDQGRPQPLSSLIDFIQEQNDLAQVGLCRQEGSQQATASQA